MRVEKRKEELSQKRYWWANNSVALFGKLFFAFQALPDGREAKSTPTSAYSLGNFLLSCLPY